MSIYPRERITDALQDSANRGIAMVIAPAGFGKTEAVVDAFGKSAHWIEVSENGVTVEGLARAIIDAAAPHALRALSPLLARAADEENRAHLTGWVASRLRTVEQPIILEDFQRACRDPDVLAFIRSIVESTVPTIRWVFLSRETPELPLGTWLARDYMTLPVTNDDLAFDFVESRGVADAMSVDIDEASLHELTRDVFGWPLALRLSLGSWERTRALPALRIRTRSVLFDFLESEIWAHLSDMEREFFEAAAHLSELRPRILTAAGFPESRLSLEQLHRRLPLLSKLGNGAFRLHELFRDFISERPIVDAEARSLLIKRLARSLERFGSFEESIALSLRISDWDGAIALLSRRGVDRIEAGHRAELASILKQFPRKLHDHPVVTGLRGYILAIDGLYDLAKREIDSALNRDLDVALRGPLALVSADLAFNVRDWPTAMRLYRSIMSDEFLDDAIRIKASASLAMACAMAGERDAARDAIGFCVSGLEAGTIEVRSFVRHRLAYAHFCLGELAIAEHYATECAQLAHSVGLESFAARAYTILLNVASALNPDTLAVRQYAESCLRSAEIAGDKAMRIFALESLVFIACCQGDDNLFDSSTRTLREVQGKGTPNNFAWMQLHRAIREAGRGNIDGAMSELSRPTRSLMSKSEVALIDAAMAVLSAPTDYDRAEALLARPALGTAERDFQSTVYLTYAQTFHSLGHWLLGRGRAARRARMPSLEDLPPLDTAVINVIGTICSSSRQTITERKLEQFTEPLLALGLNGYARFLRTVLAPASIHELTRTELDVLRALRHGGTTAEVAERLGKSSHTVLSHIKAACSKIGCSGRSAAVSYAVDRGWID